MNTNSYQQNSGEGKKFAIVRARYNEEITSGLLEGCRATLLGAGVSENEIKVVEVPGSFEICYTIEQVARANKFDAIICLGAIIKGETTHDEHLATAIYHAMQAVARKYLIPIAAGIITTKNLEQAQRRSSGEMNRGVEAAKVAIEMTQKCSGTL